MWKFMSVFLMVFIVTGVVTGCYFESRYNKDEIWDYKEGYVFAKENGRILVLREYIKNEKPLNELLPEVKPNAILLSVDEVDYNEVSIGDHINIMITHGIDQSYPAMAKADVSKIIQ